MTHINIDHQPEAVKQFFQSLALPPEGSVVEMNGRPLARLLRASARDAEWNDAQHARRSTLIGREIAGTLTIDESLELERLQEEFVRYLDRVAPLPFE